MEKSIAQEKSSVLRIVFFGPESTGKSTLAKAAAKKFNTVWVAEYAREYLQKKWDTKQKICEEKDILPIAYGQLADENRLIKKANTFIFTDTNILETKIYAEQYYENYHNDTLNKLIAAAHYDFYFLTDIDVPYEADELRDRPHMRQEMFDAFKKGLETHNCNYEILSGSVKKRLQKVEKRLNHLLKQD